MQYQNYYYLIQVILCVIGGLTTWNAFIEKRIQSMYKQLVEKIDAKQELNQVIQGELKDDIKRLENKIDTLININLESLRRQP